MMNVNLKCMPLVLLYDKLTYNGDVVQIILKCICLTNSRSNLKRSLHLVAQASAGPYLVTLMFDNILKCATQYMYVFYRNLS